MSLSLNSYPPTINISFIHCLVNQLQQAECITYDPQFETLVCLSSCSQISQIQGLQWDYRSHIQPEQMISLCGCASFGEQYTQQFTLLEYIIRLPISIREKTSLLLYCLLHLPHAPRGNHHHHCDHMRDGCSKDTSYPGHSYHSDGLQSLLTACSLPIDSLGSHHSTAYHCELSTLLIDTLRTALSVDYYDITCSDLFQTHHPSEVVWHILHGAAPVSLFEAIYLLDLLFHPTPQSYKAPMEQLYDAMWTFTKSLATNTLSTCQRDTFYTKLAGLLQVFKLYQVECTLPLDMFPHSCDLMHPQPLSICHAMFASSILPTPQLVCLLYAVYPHLFHSGDNESQCYPVMLLLGHPKLDKHLILLEFALQYLFPFHHLDTIIQHSHTLPLLVASKNYKATAAVFHLYPTLITFKYNDYTMYHLLFRHLSWNKFSTLHPILSEHINNQENASRESPLHALCADDIADDHLEVCKALIESKANINATDIYGRTPVDLLALSANNIVSLALMKSYQQDSTSFAASNHSIE